MGTRADFYVGRGESAEWLGSIAFDGYPEGIYRPVLTASDEGQYRRAVADFLKDRDDATLPEQGWPWPWDDSRTTDYAYAFDDGQVYAAIFGHRWNDPLNWPDKDEPRTKECVFPDMSEHKNFTLGPRSGVIVASG